MPRGYRLFIAALVGWLILAGTAEGKRQQGDQAHKEAASEQGNRPSTAPKPPKPNATQGEASNPKCTDGAGKEADCTIVATQAAVDQASDADWQTRAAIFGSVISLFTLLAAGAAAYFAERAAHYTNVSATEAKRAADAAEDAVAETKRIGEAQGRAYISIDKAWIKFDDYATPTLIARFQNSGQSPTRLFNWQFAVSVTASGPVTVRPDHQANWFTEMCPSIPGGASIKLSKIGANTFGRGRTYSGIVADDQIPAFFACEDIYCWVNVKVFWKDVFGRKTEEMYGFCIFQQEAIIVQKRYLLDQSLWIDSTVESGHNRDQK